MAVIMINEGGRMKRIQMPVIVAIAVVLAFGCTGTKFIDLEDPEF
jgi:hypothetical protein